MKKIGFLASLLLTLGIATSSALAIGTSEAYYITFDDFAMINTSNPDTTMASPYDSDELGGVANIGAINDTSEYAGFEAKREFNKTDGIATLEFCFTTIGAPEGITLNFRCGDVDAITFKNINGKFYLLTGQGQKEILPLLNGFYGIRALLDIDKNTYSVQLNGTTIGTDFKFLNHVDYLDNFYVLSTTEGTGSINLDAMRISKGYSLNEWFIATQSTVPDDWKQLNNGGSMVKMNSSLLNDRYSLQINDGDFTEECGVSHEIEYDSDELWVEYQFFLPKKVKDYGATLESKGKDIIKFGTQNLDYGYWLNGEFKPVYTVRENLWYHSMIKLTKNGAKLYINHKLVADNIPIDLVKIDNIRFAIGKVATGTVCIDDMIVHPIHPLPDDYVPAPNKPKKKTDVMVGMQSCNIWREGTHFGWDSIAAYPERITYLGFFDEGSSEVKDWETKWMVDHGVDFEIYCWYRQPSSNKEPIKRPRNSFALHDGFFNGEYSDQMKFIISWENGSSCGGKEDFETNMVPYWIEQYFKDDRYYKIDNKPVIGFYLINNLVKDFGSVEGVKAEIEYLESECKKAGFDGIYSVLTDGSSSVTQLQKIKNAGIDALYCYSWGMKTYIPEIQKTGLNSQLNSGIIDVLATIGANRDDTPWERNHGGAMDKESLVGLLEWARDDFMPRSGELGKKIITIDNWNEFGEGHFFYPSNFVGFDYLDALREVFTEGGEHDDPRPTEAQLARINHLYVQSRRTEKTYTAKDYLKKKAEEEANEAGTNFELIQSVNFDNADDTVDKYPVAKQIDNFKIENGIASGTATDSDPGFFINNINLNAKEVKQVKVRFKASTPAAKFQIYYISDLSKNWQEGKSTYAEVSTNGEFVDIVLDFTDSQAWDGTITDLRIDPMASEGTFAIDYIDFYGQTSTMDLRKAVNFDADENIDDYPVAKQVENLRLEDGLIKGTATDVDPGFFLNGLNLVANEVKQIKVRFKASTPAAKFQLYYVTDVSPNWQEAKSVLEEVSTNGEFVEVTYDPTTNPAWSNVITDIRVDPMATTGEFEIDYIEFWGQNDETLLIIDGDSQHPKRPITIIDGTMYVPAAEYAGYFELKWSKSLDGKTLKLLNEESGQRFNFEIGEEAIEVEGEVYFPLRKVATAVGYAVSWDGNRNCAILTSENGAEAVVVDTTPDPFGTFNFNKPSDFQGFSFSNVSGQKVAKGILTLNASSTEALMNSTTLAFPSDEFRYCNIKIKNKSQGNIVKVYFSTDTEPNMNEAKAVSRTMSKNDSDFKVYSLDMKSNSLWKGDIRAIRIDPTDGAGKVEIDYIIFSNTKMEGDAAASGGEQVDTGVNVLTGGTIDNKDLVYTPAGLSASYSSDEGYVGRYSLKLTSDSDTAYIKLPVKISSNCAYKFTLWKKSANVTDLKIGSYDVHGDLSEGTVSSTEVGSEWTKISVSLPSNHGDAEGIYINPGKGTVYLDGLRLAETQIVKQEEPKNEWPKEREKARTGATRVLIIGNSITQHAVSESKGWLGNWGMAATSEDKDYVHLLKKMAESKDPKVEFKWKNISEFEKYFYDFTKFNSNNYKDLAEWDADIIIVAIGANINYSAFENDAAYNSGMQFSPEKYENIIRFFDIYGDSKVLVCLTPLLSYDKCEIIKEAAEKYSQTLVDMSGIAGDQYTAKPYRDAPVFTADVIDGVLGHPGDDGMKKMAETLWPELEKAMSEVKR